MLGLIQNVENKFAEVASDARFRFFGNVCVTASNDTPPPPSSLAVNVPITELAPYYTHVLFAYGANEARPLGVPGSGRRELRNVYPALDFVEWYNGHPDAHDPAMEDAYSLNRVDGSKIHRAAIVGAGNVALDVARVLLRQCPSVPAGESLAKTDVPQPVLDHLASWQIKEVNLYVRRGAPHLAFTNKELREMLGLPHVAFRPLPADLLDTGLEQVNKLAEAGQKRAMTRLLGQLKKGSKLAYNESQYPRWGLHLLRSPAALHGDGATPPALASVDWNVTQISEHGRAVTQGETVRSDEDLLISSVGYRSEPLRGETDSAMQVPFDETRCVIPNIRNRVVDEEGQPIPGMFVSGWLATGPVGVIVSTMFDAFGVADEMVKEWRASSIPTLCGAAGHAEALRDTPEALQGQRTVSFDQWRVIDEAERQRGEALGKTREKFLTVADMLKVVE